MERGRPTTTILGVDLGEVRGGLPGALARGPGKDALQRVQIAQFTAVLHFRPSPIKPAMMRMVHGPIQRQLFAVETVKRMDVVTAGAGVYPIVRVNLAETPARFDGLIIVPDRLTRIGMSIWPVAGSLVTHRVISAMVSATTADRKRNEKQTDAATRRAARPHSR